MFENAIIWHFATRFRAVLALLLGNLLGLFFSLAHPPPRPQNNLVPVFSCEKALNIKKIIKIEGLGLGWLLSIDLKPLATVQSP
jgi:hypothetical protein